MSNKTSAAPIRSVRLTSLDQFRGYTILGMLVVDYLACFKAFCPQILSHTDDYCSYADTIMPQFLFAAGFAMRLSLGKRVDAGGNMPWNRAVRRILGLFVVAIVCYLSFDFYNIIGTFEQHPVSDVLLLLFKGTYFQALTHIAATSLWILPVIASSSRTRIGYAVGSGSLHVLLSWWFNFEWVHSEPRGIDGGPLGFLTWSMPALCGTLACEAVRASGTNAALRIAISGVGMMLVGWAMSFGTVLYNVDAGQISLSETGKNTTPAYDSTPIANGSNSISDDQIRENRTNQENPGSLPSPAFKPSISRVDPQTFPPDPVIPSFARLRAWDGTIVEPPFVPPPETRDRKWNYWMMSKRSGSASYQTFAAGSSLVVYAFFLWICDGMHLRVGILRTLGMNSLSAYILHGVALLIVCPNIPSDSTAVVLVMMGFEVYFLFVYGFSVLLEWLGWNIRL